jgi:hypothetical protein
VYTYSVWEVRTRDRSLKEEEGKDGASGRLLEGQRLAGPGAEQNGGPLEEDSECYSKMKTRWEVSHPSGLNTVICTRDSVELGLKG